VGFMETYEALVKLDIQVPGAGTGQLALLAAELGKLPAPALAAAKGLEQAAMAAQQLNAKAATALPPNFLTRYNEMAMALQKMSPLYGGSKQAYQALLTDQRAFVRSQWNDYMAQYRAARSQVVALESQFMQTYGFSMGAVLSGGTRGPGGRFLPRTARTMYGQAAAARTTQAEMSAVLGGIWGISRSDAEVGRIWKTMRTGAEGAKDSLKGVVTQQERMNQMLQRTAVSMMVLYQLKAVFSGLVSEARAFQTATIQTEAILSRSKFFGQGTPVAGRALQQEVRGMAARYGTNATAVMGTTNTIFQAADISTVQALKVADIAHQAAVATRTDIGTMTDIFMSAYNALNLKAEDLLGFSDKLITMWKDGVITFQQAGDALGKVFQAARLFGVTDLLQMNKIFAMMTVATKQGGSVQRNMTAMENVLYSFTKPKTREQLIARGVTFSGDTAFEQNFGALSQVIERGDKFINETFTDFRTRRGLSILLNQWDTFKEEVQKMEGAAGTTREALNRMMDDPSMRLQKLQAHLANAAGVVGRDFVAAIDKAVSPILRLFEAQDKLLSQTDQITNYTGVMRGLFEVLSMASMISMGGAATGTLLGIGMPMVRGAQAAGFWKNLAGASVGRGLMAPFVAGGMVPEAALGGVAGSAPFLAGGGLATTVGAAAVVGLGAWVGYEAYHQSQLDQQARLGERIRVQAEDATDAMDALREAAQRFGDAYKDAMETGSDRTGDMVNAIADVISITPQLGEDYGIVAEQGKNFITVHGEMVTSIQELQGWMEKLSVEAYADKLRQMQAASIEFLKYTKMELWDKAKEQSKSDYADSGYLLRGFIEKRPAPQGLFAPYSTYNYSTGRYEVNPNSVGNTRIESELRTYFDRNRVGPRNQFGGTAEGAQWLKELDTFMQQYGININELYGSTTQRDYTSLKWQQMQDEQQQKLTELLEGQTKDQEEIADTTHGLNANMAVLDEETGEAAEKLQGLPKAADQVLSKLEGVRTEIDVQLEMEQKTGELTQDKLEARRKELEQQKVIPLLIEAEVIKKQDINKETDKIYQAHQTSLDWAWKIVDQLGYQAQVQAIISQATKDYAEALLDLTSAARDIDTALKEASAAATQRLNDINNLAAGQSAATDTADWWIEQLISQQPPERQAAIKALIAPGIAWGRMQGANADLFNKSTEYDRLQGEWGTGGAARGRVMLDALGAIWGGVPWSTNQTPTAPLVGPQSPVSNWTDFMSGADADWQGLYDRSVAIRGDTDKLCAIFTAERMRRMGIPVPLTVSTTEELMDWINENMNPQKITDVNQLKWGDVVFSTDPTLEGSPAGHVSMSSGKGTIYDQHGTQTPLKDFRFALRPMTGFAGVTIPAGVDTSQAPPLKLEWFNEFLVEIGKVMEVGGLEAANKLIQQLGATGSVTVGGRSFSVKGTEWKDKYAELFAPWAQDFQTATDQYKEELLKVQTERQAAGGNALTAVQTLFESVLAGGSSIEQTVFSGENAQTNAQYMEKLASILGVNIPWQSWIEDPLGQMQAFITQLTANPENLDVVGQRRVGMMQAGLNLFSTANAFQVQDWRQLPPEVLGPLLNELGIASGQLDAAMTDDALSKQREQWSKASEEFRAWWDELKAPIKTNLESLPEAISRLSSSFTDAATDLDSFMRGLREEFAKITGQPNTPQTGEVLPSVPEDVTKPTGNPKIDIVRNTFAVRRQGKSASGT